jgi:hypothetical protein
MLRDNLTGLIEPMFSSSPGEVFRNVQIAVGRYRSTS